MIRLIFVLLVLLIFVGLVRQGTKDDPRLENDPLTEWAIYHPIASDVLFCVICTIPWGLIMAFKIWRE